MTSKALSSEPMLHEEWVLTSPYEERPFACDIRCRQTSKKLPLVLFLHGFKGFKDWGPFNLVADRFANAGFAFAKLSFSHCGTTLEEPNRLVDIDAFAKDNITIQMDDLQVLFEELFDAKRNPLYDQCDLSRVYLVGHSRGGSLALLTAREHQNRVKGVATWSAVANFEDLWSQISLFLWRMRGFFWEWDQWHHQYLPVHYQVAADYYKHRQRLHVLTAVNEFKAPLFIAHALDDNIVPPTMALEIAERHERTESLILHRGGHLLGMTHPWRDPHLPPALKRVVEGTCNFFLRLP